MLHTDFDPCKTAIINPADHFPPNPEMPENLIGVFSYKIVDEYVNKLNAVEVARSNTCMGPLRIWKCKWYDGTEFALTMMTVGGPSAISIMEETIPMGVKRFVMLGSCGALDHNITAGHIIVPEAAVRDEGTSYHYLPAAEEVALDARCVDAVCKALESLDAPYARTKTWTTDAFYRETRAKMEKRLQQGCAVVEMECASMAAVAQFRGVDFAQFFWAADSLSGEVWDARNLSALGMDENALYMETAVRAFRYM